MLSRFTTFNVNGFVFLVMFEFDFEITKSMCTTPLGLKHLNFMVLC